MGRLTVLLAVLSVSCGESHCEKPRSPIDTDAGNVRDAGTTCDRPRILAIVLDGGDREVEVVVARGGFVVARARARAGTYVDLGLFDPDVYQLAARTTEDDHFLVGGDVFGNAGCMTEPDDFDFCSALEVRATGCHTHTVPLALLCNPFALGGDVCGGA